MGRNPNPAHLAGAKCPGIGSKHKGAAPKAPSRRGSRCASTTSPNQEDSLYLPSNITFFSAVPTDATVDARYLDSTDDLFLAGLWRERDAAVASAAVIVHGTTTADSRYLGLATNPFSRGDAEREWALMGQAALWSNLTDEV